MPEPNIYYDIGVSNKFEDTDMWMHWNTSDKNMTSLAQIFSKHIDNTHEFTE